MNIFMLGVYCKVFSDFFGGGKRELLCDSSIFIKDKIKKVKKSEILTKKSFHIKEIGCRIKKHLQVR